ncbi:o-succinylbenzoate synthase [Leptolyngbya iicbica]|uniref:o-succinylbenzoate synthase n=2 Tax=Cyanophyceae TaxID=3028117 RepID=A0A4Q7EF98_9CYAN|nr:o-succinylbenzoate synthase [Leptolyngbya sp. LK]RZM82534.1 o-succinylbenzoate synthase [Leptolyngbya sp. LK]
MRVEVRPYRRPFRQPLQTAHGPWAVREGIILRFEDEQGQVTFGEIAPIPWFGTETLEQARAWCDRFSRNFALEQIDDIPDSLPACQFGFGAARDRVAWVSPARFEMPSLKPPGPLSVCALLPTGAAALEGWQGLWEQGHRTFKWKIGVAALAEELSLFQQLVKAVPSELRLRLDANGGLTGEEAATWLAECDRAPLPIEFLEQPLPPAQILDWLPQVKGQFQTAIAVDESVATFRQLQQVYERVGRQVVYVVKPAIAGDSQRLAHFCLQHRPDVVFSSALETPIGRHQALRLAQALWNQGISKRALGFGVEHWFADDWATLSAEALWAQL